jgi:transposase
MKLDAAFDTSATTTEICIVNSRDGAVVLETSARTDPHDLYRVLSPYLARLHRVGLEAGAWSPWLYRELVARGVPMVLLGTRHAAAALKAQRNKTDRNDARGLTQLEPARHPDRADGERGHLQPRLRSDQPAHQPERQRQQLVVLPAEHDDRHDRLHREQFGPVQRGRCGQPDPGTATAT